jgi:hypothetical protein
MKSIAVNPISTLVATIAIVVQVITAISGFSQDGPVQHNRKALLKAGLFIVPYHQTPELSSLHVELEKPFPRKKFLTSGPRLDYLRPMNDSQGNLFIGYAFKFYPLHWKLQKSFQGPFISHDMAPESLPYSATSRLLKRNILFHSKAACPTYRILTIAARHKILKDDIFMSF